MTNLLLGCDIRGNEDGLPVSNLFRNRSTCTAQGQCESDNSTDSAILQRPPLSKVPLFGGQNSCPGIGNPVVDCDLHTVALLQIHNHHASAILSEAEGGGAAETGARARNKGDALGERHGGGGWDGALRLQVWCVIPRRSEQRAFLELWERTPKRSPGRSNGDMCVSREELFSCI